MELREYRAEDSVGVRDLILAVLKKEYPFGRSAYRDTDINDITGSYTGEGSAFFVIEEDGKIVGSIGVKKETAESALIRRLCVDESRRKKGYGTMLLKRAIEFCKSRRYKAVIFRATDRMLPAMNLCKKAGFSEKENLEVSGFHIHSYTLPL